MPDLSLVPDPSAVRALRSDLTAAEYSVDAVRSLWGGPAEDALHRGDRVPAARAVEATRIDGVLGEARAVLARLFILGLPVLRAELAAALPALGSADAARLGLVGIEGERASPALDLRPYAVVDDSGVGSWWIASDLGEIATGGALREDHVLGVGGASTTLSGLLDPEPVETALDLGTGCGIQALHLARRARRVVATDVSERALWFARLNALLAGVDRIEFRRGDLFAPVAGERFDRIASNPPFVITPRTGDVPRYEYRDGGRTGDDLVKAVVQGCARHLHPGGLAQLLGNWEYGSREHETGDGMSRVRGWVEEAGLEAWVIERERLDPARYAETWIRDGGGRGQHETERLTAQWLDDFERRGVTGIGFGYLTLRRPRERTGAAPPLLRFECVSGAAETPSLGRHLTRCLAGMDALAVREDRELRGLHFTVAPDVTEERHHWPGQEDPTAILLRQGGGMGRVRSLDTATAAFVGACDGELAAGAIIDALAQLLDVAPRPLSDAILAEVRELVAQGFLVVGAPA